jgi:twinkle protein
MADILAIKRMLASRAQAVAEHLLPGGRRDGAEWRAGSIGGEKGQSLGVHLIGDKAGVWSDFASDHGGDLIDLWAAVKSVTLAEAIDQARDWLGVERPTVHRPVREKPYVKPEKPKCVKPKGAVRLYLTEDRNISDAAIDAYRVGEDGRRMVFPYLRDGSLVMVKWEGIDRDADGKKVITSSPDTEDCLFGWHVIPDAAREAMIVEGEKDALSMFDYGWPALSVPRGGGGGAKQKWIEGDYERMDRFERIYIATDMDDQGDAAAEEIANRLGRHRCVRVRLPHKDANECLVAGVSREDMDRCIARAENMDPEGLRRPSDYADNVIALFWPAEGTHVGYTTPYSKIGDKLLFRPAEVTLWTGATGSGKSQLLSDCTVEWIRQGSRCCVSSLEMKPAQLFKRMVKQVVGTDRPTERAIRDSLEWLDRGLLAYELTGKAKADELLDVFGYARAKYGCDQFVIDSLMRLGVAGDDYNGQEAAIYRIVDWTIANNVHTHLVAHAKKGDRDRAGAPDAEDIKGAMEIGANAFNVIGVWRNRKLEDEVKAAEQAARTGDPVAVKTLEGMRDKPGVVMNIAKQRNGDFEGKIGLWFDQETYQYRSSHDASLPRRYLAQDNHRRTA